MFDEATRDDVITELPLEACRQIVDQQVELCRRLSARTEVEVVPRFILSGGDPLLHPQFWDVLEYVSEVDRHTMILGNADHLDEAGALELAAQGVKAFQISLDGLEATHDRIRGAGSFAESLSGLDRLREAGIAPHVMTTIFKDNLSDLPALIELATARGAASVAFARATAFGNARDLDLAISPEDYRELLIEVDLLQRRLQREGATTRYPRKDHLWTLLLHERGERPLYPHVNPGKTTGGCHMGQSFLVLLADGQAMACRRFHSPLGRWPEHSLSELFLASPQIAEYRRVRDLEKCSRCELLWVCRGCPAVAAGHHGDWRAPDPQCWKVIDHVDSM